MALGRTKNSFKRRLACYFLLVLIIPAAILSYVYYRQGAADILKNAEDFCDEMLTHTLEILDSNISGIEAFAHSLAQSGWVRKIAYMQGENLDYDRLDMYTLMQYSEAYSTAEKGNPLIQSSALLFPAKNLAITAKGSMPLYSVFHSYFFSLGKTVLPPQSAVTANDERFWNFSYKDGVWQLYYIQRLPIERERVNVQLITLVNRNSIVKTLSSSGGEYPMYVFSGDTEIVSVGASPALSAAVKNLNGEKTITADGVEYYAFYKLSDKTDWRFICLIPLAQMLSGIISMRNTTLILCVCVAAIGATMILCFTRSTYKPIRKLSELVLPGDGAVVNEIDAMERVFRHLAESKSELGEKLNQFAPLAREAFFLKALCGAISPEDADALTRSLEINARGVCWAVAVLAIAPGETFRLYNDKDAYTVQLDSDRLALVAGGRQYADAAAHALKPLEGCASARVGVSGPRESISELADAYVEACVALEYSAGAPAYYRQLFEREQLTFEYAREDENAFANALRAGSLDAARAQAEKLYELNAARGPLAVRCLRYNLIATILRTARADRLPNLETNATITMLAHGDTRGYLDEMLARVCKEEAERLSKCTDTGSDVANYVAAHFTDARLSLTSLAEQFKVTPQHISRVYSESVGVPFLASVTAMRLEYAKERMLNSYDALDAISLMAGFENPVAFRRAFKKAEGLPPAEYRQIHKKPREQ